MKKVFFMGEWNMPSKSTVSYFDKMNALIDAFRTEKIANNLSAEKIEKYKSDYLDLVKDCRTDMEKSGEIETPIMEELDHMRGALNNGWGLEDMVYLSSLSRLELPFSSPLEEQRRDLLRRMETQKVSNSADRMSFFGECAAFMDELKETIESVDPEKNPTEEVKKAVSEKIGDLKLQNLNPLEDSFYNVIYRKLDWQEYPEDTTISRNNSEDKIVVATSHNRDGLMAQGLARNRMQESEKDALRNKNTYVLPERSLEDEVFVPTGAHIKREMTVSNREGIKEVFGSAIYEDIDRAYLGSPQDRTVRLHHALGNQYRQRGENVLEIDLAGSGFSQKRVEYKGIHGKDYKEGAGNQRVQEMLEAQFGRKISRFDGESGKEEKLEHVRMKSREYTPEQAGPNAQPVRKVRYTISGPLARVGVLAKGTSNSGAHSINNNIRIIQRAIWNFLDPIFEEYKKAIDQDPNFVPKTIHVNLTGHSRGAVAAGEGMLEFRKKLQEWANRPENAKYQRLVSAVEFDIIQRDPVPGLGSYSNHPMVDYRNMPNVSSTVVYTMESDKMDGAFIPQRVRGAARIILGTTPHSAGLEEVDMSQVDVEGDGMAHAMGYYDPETGEVYRGSGLSEMPQGVYFTDEAHNLVRVESLAQLEKMMDVITVGGSRQPKREAVMRTVVRDWIIDHQIERSYRDDLERGLYQERTHRAAETILNCVEGDPDYSPTIRELQEAIREYRSADPADRDAYEAAQEKLIGLAKAAMQNRTISPGVPDPLLVVLSDLTVGMMHENAFLRKGYTLESEGRLQQEAASPLKAATDEEKEAMQAEGALSQQERERRLQKEEKVLLEETRLKTDVLVEAQEFQDVLNRMDRMKKSREDTASYRRMRNAVEVCANLGGNSTINEIREAYGNLQKTSEDYAKEHSSMESFRGQLGTFRLGLSRELSAKARELGEKFYEQSRFMNNKDNTLDTKIRLRTESMQRMAGREKVPFDYDRSKSKIQKMGEEVMGLARGVKALENQFRQLNDTGHINSKYYSNMMFSMKRVREGMEAAQGGRVLNERQSGELLKSLGLVVECTRRYILEKTDNGTKKEMSSEIGQNRMKLSMDTLKLLDTATYRSVETLIQSGGRIPLQPSPVKVNAPAVKAPAPIQTAPIAPMGH